MPIKRYIVSIDFGTTCSAVAYFKEVLQPTRNEKTKEVDDDRWLRVRPADLRTIGDYPGSDDWSHGKDSLKEVPTLLWYDGDQVDWGFTVQDHRTSPVRPPGTQLSRFKLLLDDSEYTKNVRESVNQTLQSLDIIETSKTVDAVITEYLTRLLLHTKEQLGDDGLRGSDQVDFVITIPTIWKHIAQERMLRLTQVAAQRATFGKFSVPYVVSDSEAAAALLSHADMELDLEVAKGLPHLLCSPN